MGPGNIVGAQNQFLCATQLAELLEKHDQHKSDISNRAEGTCEAIAVLAKRVEFSVEEKKRLADGIIKCFRQYNQTETIGRGEDSQFWPTNRFAIAALNAIGLKKPAAQKAA